MNPAPFDRDGKSQGTLGLARDFYRRPGPLAGWKRVALDQADLTGNRNIWMLDVARATRTRFTVRPGVSLGPVWSPDGGRIAFSSGASGSSDIYQKDSSGSANANEELLLKSGIAWDWSPDGQYLLYGLQDPKTKGNNL